MTKPSILVLFLISNLLFIANGFVISIDDSKVFSRQSALFGNRENREITTLADPKIENILMVECGFGNDRQVALLFVMFPSCL